MSRFRKMTLRSKINALVTLNILFVLILVISAMFYIVVDKQFKETGEQALGVAKTVAGLPQIVEAFEQANPSLTIQPITEQIWKNVGADVIVVSNMNLIRYSHSNPAEIGKHMVGDDNEAVLKGRESITQAKGSLGYSVRGKAPIFDGNHKQIGLVSVVFLLDSVWSQLFVLFEKVLVIGAAALIFGLIGAYLLSGHIKKQIFNMEPHEIAFVTQEQSAILDAICEGIIAVNKEGNIVTCNREAKKMLGKEDNGLIGKHISDIIPITRLPEVLENGISQRDQPTIIGNTLVIANRVPVTLSGRVIGAVSTFRDKMQLEQIDERLADIGRYVDTLRSQRHEFMNKLHLIAGLIQISEYDQAKAVIHQINEEHQDAIHFYLARIRDSAVVGILIGKTHRARELGIQLLVSPESYIPEKCPHREIIVTILGNTIENSFEAIQMSSIKIQSPTVTVFLKEEDDDLLIHVKDNGPGVDPAIKDTLFNDGTTTKGEGRGFGLAYVFRLVSNQGGFLTCDSSSDGTMIRISLPIRRNVQ
ncbi:PAS domain-containing protein [Paenibacillus sp. LMG 31456]|uniref:histidine kinase n=1 Tax=Paenibacillus foliorum TaxID=2654974 RepID=A0A972H7I3_9BACL|nr:sensor histidine kinase [Paenibacillus foliorum]NOU97831.1 PAS domain-containing protein [Paenibacillus foliorum]